MAVQQNEAISRFLGALDRHDADELRSVLAADFIFEDVAGEGEQSVNALLTECGMVFDAFPDIVFRPVRQTAERDRHYVEFRAFGTHRGEFLHVPPTGTLAIVSGVFNLAEDGRVIRRLRLTIDFGGLRRQLLLAASRQS